MSSRLTTEMIKNAKSHQTEKLLQHLTDLEVENTHLRTTLSQIEEKYEALLRQNAQSLDLERDNVQSLTKNLSVFQNENSRLEIKIQEIMVENNELRSELENQFKKNIDKFAFSDLENEINKIRDPKSFGILRRLMTEMSKIQGQLERLEGEAIGERSKAEKVKQMSSSYKQKNRMISGEVKALRGKVDQLQTQNDFLLNELKYSQRKLKESFSKKGGNGSVQIACREGRESDNIIYKDLVNQICEILSIQDESTLIDSVKTIETAYQFLPSLQITVENIYKIVTEGNIFETPINSYDDLAETVENWSMNLADYKNLVDGLINILEIEEEENKTVNYILETISQMTQNLINEQQVDTKNLTQNDNNHFVTVLKEIVGVDSKEEVLDKIANMLKFVKNQDYVAHFLDIARDKLEIDEAFSDEATFNKILTCLDQIVEGSQDED